MFDSATSGHLPKSPACSTNFYNIWSCILFCHKQACGSICRVLNCPTSFYLIYRIPSKKCESFWSNLLKLYHMNACILILNKYNEYQIICIHLLFSNSLQQWLSHSLMFMSQGSFLRHLVLVLLDVSRGIDCTNIWLVKLNVVQGW